MANVFHTSPGDPLTFGYSSVTADVTALLQAQSGNTLRLRFADTDNQFLQNFGVDVASLQISGTVTPEPGSAALLASCGIAASGLLRLRRSRQQS